MTLRRERAKITLRIQVHATNKYQFEVIRTFSKSVVGCDNYQEETCDVRLALPLRGEHPPEIDVVFLVSSQASGVEVETSTVPSDLIHWEGRDQFHATFL